MKNYIGSQQHWEDSINDDYDQRERMDKEQKRDEREQDFDGEENNFNPCDNCDQPDACEDFGCAIKTGVRQVPPTSSITTNT